VTDYRWLRHLHHITLKVTASILVSAPIPVNVPLSYILQDKI
jgi:hypothetical protein